MPGWSFHDNNLFRSDKGAKQSDLITAFFVEAAVDKQISRQRLLLEARLSDNRYRHNDRLWIIGEEVLLVNGAGLLPLSSKGIFH